MGNLENLLERIPDSRKDIVVSIYHHYQDLFYSNPGSTHIHQTWKGGLADHLTDMLRLSYLEYNLLSQFIFSRGETLPFSLGSAQVVIFAHDAEKVIVYADKQDSRYRQLIDPDTIDATDKTFKENLKWRVLDYWAKEFGFILTEAEINAVRYTHGEGEDYQNTHRVMNELAAFVGNIDRTSARILYNSGKDLG